MSIGAEISPEAFREMAQHVLEAGVDLIEEDLKENPDRPRGRAGVTVAYRCMYLLQGFRREPCGHFVGEGEKKVMREFHDRGFTIGEIAYIFNRSKSTVHGHVSGPQTMKRE